ncbi:hypothetical protein Pmani_033886 [Petrolisthes manimaculis]|uniref:Uncharacterized protein n=1 Tax=Petrolisthes manimaculis TaxID=1843537 RepID=A0AAE1TPZ2_9EUCA|nr:hypothetical protein Pmani_033886 [Petrolisthes manimaculis]
MEVMVVVNVVVVNVVVNVVVVVVNVVVVVVNVVVVEVVVVDVMEGVSFPGVKDSGLAVMENSRLRSVWLGKQTSRGHNFESTSPLARLHCSQVSQVVE